MDNPTLLETWDMLSEETVWVWVKDPRAGTMTKKRLGGKGGGGTRVLHITSDDRRFNQEQIVEENATTDPFTNGALKLRDATKVTDVDTSYHMTNDDLRGLLAIKDQATFEAEIDDIHSELILRRLKDISESEATIAQYTYVRDLVDKRYRSGGTQATVREMLEEEARQAGTNLR
jgi:hypothetical protein